MISAVIFDLDGLLVDSEPVWFDVRTEMFERFGKKWTDEDQKALMGRSTQAWIDYVFKKLEGRLTKDEVTTQTLDGMVRSYKGGKIRQMKGAQKALEYCSHRWTIGLASGSPRLLIEAAIEGNHWDEFFTQKLSSDEVAHGKPAPDVYAAVMRSLNVKPSNCVVLEDSASGILAGLAAGAKVIAVPNTALMPPGDVLSKANCVVTSLEEIERGMNSIESATLK